VQAFLSVTPRGGGGTPRPFWFRPKVPGLNKKPDWVSGRVTCSVWNSQPPQTNLSRIITNTNATLFSNAYNHLYFADLRKVSNKRILSVARTPPSIIPRWISKWVGEQCFTFAQLFFAGEPYRNLFSGTKTISADPLEGSNFLRG